MGINRILAGLRNATPIIAPSLLAADFGNLEREIRRLEEAGARVLHLDVMDGHFVPNLSFGLPVIQAVRRLTELPLDVHLMIDNPGRHLAAFRRAGADLITVHIEVAQDPVALLSQIRALGAGAGITLNPPTPVSAVEGCLDHCDLVLTMSVMPGFGGQEFQPASLDKLRWLRSAARPATLLSVDGGVNPKTIAACAEAGADVFVVGTALLGYPDYTRRIAELTSLAKVGGAVRV